MSRKKTPQDYHILAEKRGFEWLGPEVRNTDTKTTWKCTKGHEWQTDYGHIKQGGCPHCAGLYPKQPEDYIRRMSMQDIWGDFLDRVAVTILIFFVVMMVIALGSIVFGHISHRRDCLRLGDNYVYVDGGIKLTSCRRVVDGQLHYVNVREEWALRDSLPISYGQ